MPIKQKEKKQKIFFIWHKLILILIVVNKSFFHVLMISMF